MSNFPFIFRRRQAWPGGSRPCLVNPKTQSHKLAAKYRFGYEDSNKIGPEAVKFIGNITSLEFLSIERNPIGDEGFRQLSRLKNLMGLELGNGNNTKDSTILRKEAFISARSRSWGDFSTVQLQVTKETTSWRSVEHTIWRPLATFTPFS